MYINIHFRLKEIPGLSIVNVSMDDHSVDSCLPVPLQDLCLLVIINDLDIYPVSLLASLPRWFRHRLLSNLPVIDLCLLDHSPVARGIDIVEIWKTRYPPRPSRMVHGQFMVQEYWMDYSHFELPMKQWRSSGREASICSARDLEGLTSKLEQALQSLPRSLEYGEYSVDHRTEYLTQIALGLLLVDENDDEFHVLRSCRGDDRVVLSSVLEAIARECVSINGNLLLQNLTKASNVPYYNLPSYSVGRHHKGVKGNYFLIWKQQGIPMSKQIDVNFEITPKRYTTIRNRANRNELVTLISQSFGLKAHNIHLDLFKLESCQSGPQVLSLLKYLLSEVQILGIYRSSGMVRPHAKQDCINVQTIMEICVGSGVECQLGALSCDLRKIDPRHLSPYLFTLDGDDKQPQYSGLSVFQCRWIRTRDKLMHTVRLIQQHLSLKYVSLHIFSKDITDDSYPESTHCFATLASLFQRPHFQVLNLRCHVKDVDLLTLLVHSFMSAPCSGTQQLSIYVSDNLPRNFIFNVSIPPHEGNWNPALDCGVEHKRLLFTTSDLNYTGLLDSCSILEVLLRFPNIRLKDLMFECVPDVGGNYPFLHLAALHPDLQLSAMLFHFNRGLNQGFLLTIKEDFKKLFSMPTLKEISIDGYWDEFPDIVQALILGLATVKSLTRISLGSYSTKYTENEHIKVWNSLFALRQLDKLEVVIKGCFVAKMKECAQLISDSWKQNLSLRRRMKSIQFVAMESPKLNSEDFLLEICETYSIVKS